MRHKSKFKPINHVDTLGFSSGTWEILASAHEKNTPPPRFIILASMQPLNARAQKFKELTKLKTDAFVTLMHTYFEETPIEFLMSDTLYLDNHSQPNEIAANELKARKSEWTELLNLPVSELSPNNVNISATYTLDSSFSDAHPEIKTPNSKPATVSSWARYQNDRLTKLMERTKSALTKILTLDNASDILLDDEKLFHSDHLGFVKTHLEAIISTEIGFKGILTDQFLELIGSFSLTATHHLKKVNNLDISLCRANADNEKRTAVKHQIFQSGPKEKLLAEFTSSFSLLIHEFCYFAELLVTHPRANGIPDTAPLHIYYACGMPYAPSYHPIYQLNYFLQCVGLRSRGFLACAEFPLSLNNNLSSHTNSSKGGDPMFHSKTQPQPIKQVNALLPSQQQDNNSLTAIPSSQATLPRPLSVDYSSGEDIPHDGNTSASSSDNGKYTSPDEGVFLTDEQHHEQQQDQQTKKNVCSDEARRTLLSFYLTQLAMNNVDKPHGQATVAAALEMMVLSKTIPDPSIMSIPKASEPASRSNSNLDESKATSSTAALLQLGRTSHPAGNTASNTAGSSSTQNYTRSI